MSTPNLQTGPPIIRLGHVFAFAALLRRHGAPAERLLRHEGIPLYSDSPDQFVPLHRAWSFFHISAQGLDPMLGWHVGRYAGDHGLNRHLLKKLETAPTLYLALKWLIDLASSEASHVRLGIIERRHDILFSTQYPSMRGVPGYTESQSYQLGLIIDLIRHFLGQNWIPEEVGVENPHAREALEEFLPGARVLAGQRFGYLSVPRSSLHVPSRRAQPEEDAEFSPVLTREFDFADTLGTLLRAYLPAGYPPARLAASLIDTSVTTLARRLSEGGTSYRTVVDRVRFEAAKELLASSDLQITDVAIAVGFDDSSNFARMFRRIAGLSPKQFRRVATH